MCCTLNQAFQNRPATLWSTQLCKLCSHHMPQLVRWQIHHLPWSHSLPMHVIKSDLAINIHTRNIHMARFDSLKKNEKRNEKKKDVVVICLSLVGNLPWPRRTPNREQSSSATHGPIEWTEIQPQQQQQQQTQQQQQQQQEKTWGTKVARQLRAWSRRQLYSAGCENKKTAVLL